MITRRLFLLSTTATALPSIKAQDSFTQPQFDESIPLTNQSSLNYLEHAKVWLDQQHEQSDQQGLKRSVINIAINGTSILKNKFSTAGLLEALSVQPRSDIFQDKVNRFFELLTITEVLVDTAGRGVVLAFNLKNEQGQPFDPKQKQPLILELYPNQIPVSEKNFSAFYDVLKQVNGMVKQGSQGDGKSNNFFYGLSQIAQNPNGLALPDLDAALKKLYSNFSETVIEPLSKTSNQLIEERKTPKRRLDLIMASNRATSPSLPPTYTHQRIG